jgi:ABC-2 type transport system ATP-binding protein
MALFPELSVRENLTVFARLAGVGADRVRAVVGDALRWADLEARAGSMVRTLSGGMRRRVNLLAGMLHGPCLLLLDEPTVGIDHEARARLLALLRARCVAGMAALVVTHDADEAAAIGDRVAVLVEGRVVACATPAALTALAFPEGSEVTVTLAAEPDPHQRLALGRAGLSSRTPRQWSGPAAGISHLAEVAARVGDAAVLVAEVRLHSPTLAGAVARLVAGARS